MYESCSPSLKFWIKDGNNLFEVITKFVYLHVKVGLDMIQTGVSMSWNVSRVTKAGIHGHSRCKHVCTIGIRQMMKLMRKHSKYNI